MSLFNKLDSLFAYLHSWCNDLAMTKVIIHKSRSEQFYGTEIEIWAGSGQADNTEKDLGR